MSSSAVIKAAIAAVVAGIPDIGKFYDTEKYAADQKEIREYYMTGSVLKGGFVARPRFEQSSADGGKMFLITTTWELHYFQGYHQETESQVSFDLMLDAIALAFRNDIRIGDVVDTTVIDRQAGINLISNQPAMFAGKLVHYARLSLPTEHTEYGASP